jgi:hypothetical protein
MSKHTSITMIAAIAGILLAGTLVVAMPAPVRADQRGDNGGNGGIGGAGGAGGVGGPGGINAVVKSDGYNHQTANGGDANGGNGGQANGGNICNHVKSYKSKVGGELCGSS